MNDLQEIDSVTYYQVVRFVDCCNGTEILFKGEVSVTETNVYQYIGSTTFTGTGGELIPNRCYTVFNELVAEHEPTYPVNPSLVLLNAINSKDCADETCADCNPVGPCECEEGFVYNPVTELCEKTVETIAEYSGNLLPVTEGQKSTQFGLYGLRTYPDITSLQWPIYGYGTSTTGYTLKEDNGAGAIVVPDDNVQNNAFGASTIPGCLTGDIGGRLNIAGIWATGFPLNEELSFEFCIEIEGAVDKQYMIGIGGDNYVKFYIDGSPAVFLSVNDNVPPGGVIPPTNQAISAIPYRKWHVFPITLSPGTHTIKLSGLNVGGSAAFAAEIYDVDYSTFQANLMIPAVGPGNCGSTEAQLEQYIIFSTRDYVGLSVPDPSVPGVWTCPDGSSVDYCNGTPVCTIVEGIALECDCYLIVPCDGTAPFNSNDPAYEIYLNTFIEVSGPEYTGCAYITQDETLLCNDSSTTTVPTGVVCDCDLICYFIQGGNGFFYVDENDEFLFISSINASPYIRICSKIPPIPQEGSDIDNFKASPVGDCTEGSCPDLCFELKSCESGEIIYSNSDVLYQYAFGTQPIIEILGKEGCWNVSLEDDPVSPACECLVDVVVVRSYFECEDCIKIIYYKLKSCTGTTVIYTQLNLEAFVGNVIKTDCGCYEVELIDFKPPNTQTITLEGLFEECIDCTRKYFELVDCKGEVDSIYTYTDLSSVVGDVIKIENCTECWTVKIVEDSQLIYQNAGEVVITNTYSGRPDNCETCAEDLLVCTCSQVTNHSETITKLYQYLNCDNELVTITLEPGESSGRICILKWIPGLCECITLSNAEIDYTFTIIGYDDNGIPIYENEDTGVQIYYNGKVWEWIFNDVVYQLDNGGNPYACPIGIWNNNPNITTEECLDPLPTIDTDFFETFGECKHGVCPPRTFPNKRVITPGYNTPICTPEKYDMITCNFADVMYNIVLEKRYGITTCCPEEVHKWMIKKELIDLQALKDPDYKCSECSYNCNSTNQCSTCKSRN